MVGPAERQGAVCEPIMDLMLPIRQSWTPYQVVFWTQATQLRLKEVSKKIKGGEGVNDYLEWVAKIYEATSAKEFSSQFGEPVKVLKEKSGGLPRVFGG